MFRQSQIPRLHADRVLVTVSNEFDAVELNAFHERNREHLEPWLPPLPPDYYTPNYWRRWAAASHRMFMDGRAARFVIRGPDDDEGPILGQISISNIMRGAFQAAYLGFHVDKDTQGKGIMTEALGLTILWAFKEAKLHRLMANYMPDNARSERLLTRLGFQKEGEAKAYMFIAGAWRDHVMTALINPNAPDPGATDRPEDAA